MTVGPGPLESAHATHEAAVLLARRANECVHAMTGAARHQLSLGGAAAFAAAVHVVFVAAGGIASPAVWGLSRLGSWCALAALDVGRIER